MKRRTKRTNDLRVMCSYICGCGSVAHLPQSLSRLALRFVHIHLGLKSNTLNRLPSGKKSYVCVVPISIVWCLSFATPRHHQLFNRVAVFGNVRLDLLAIYVCLVLLMMALRSDVIHSITQETTCYLMHDIWTTKT